jgi:hypothetical protein
MAEVAETGKRVRSLKLRQRHIHNLGVVAGLQGCRVAGLQGCRVAGLQGCRVAGFLDEDALPLVVDYGIGQSVGGLGSEGGWIRGFAAQRAKTAY